jgi:hypothetical protein
MIHWIYVCIRSRDDDSDAAAAVRTGNAEHSRVAQRLGRALSSAQHLRTHLRLYGGWISAARALLDLSVPRLLDLSDFESPFCLPVGLKNGCGVVMASPARAVGAP